jgi:hypothetical protein
MPMLNERTAVVAVTAIVLSWTVACHPDPRPAPPAPAVSAAPGTPAKPTPSLLAVASGHPAKAAPRAPAGALGVPTAPAPLSNAELVRLFTELSEPGESFFSDNMISNETSYLQVAGALADRPPGGVYIGVGPEQNYTYVALTAPELAFIVDLRRDNALLHLLYRALFERAQTRAEFLASLVGRPYSQVGDPERTGTCEAVLEHVERQPPDPRQFASAHDAAVTWLTTTLGVPLTAMDRDHLSRIHRAFFDGQLDLRFQLREPNGRTYPTLRSLVCSRDATGEAAGFLGSSAAYLRVRDLSRANRIIPLVGDFSGPHALAALGAELKSRHLELSTFYVSNVEQYLFGPEQWPRWVRNVSALPARGDAVFVRAYLDQGRAHPEQLAGHRTATVLQPVARFLERQQTRPYSTFWQLATDR